MKPITSVALEAVVSDWLPVRGFPSWPGATGSKEEAEDTSAVPARTANSRKERHRSEQLDQLGESRYRLLDGGAQSYALDTRSGGTMEMAFTAVFREVPEGYIAFVEELAGANTQGATLEEARENLREAVELVLESNRALAREEIGAAKVIREPLKIAG